MIQHISVKKNQYDKRTVFNGVPGAPPKKSTFLPEKCIFWVKKYLFGGCPRAPIKNRRLVILKIINAYMLNHKIVYWFFLYMVKYYAFQNQMSKSGQFLAQKCLFLGVAEDPLNISPLQNLHETLTKSPMYNILKIYEDALPQTFFIWQNVAY